MDFYTYVDAEVADFMNEKLIPVKIVQEQDSAGDYATLMKDLGARGIPAMGVWSVGGKDLLKSIGGWSKPEEFLAQLQEALEAAK